MLIRMMIPGALVMLLTSMSQAHALFPVWPQGDAPGAATSSTQPQIVDRSKNPALPDRAATGIRRPELTVYPAQHPNGIALLVTPGGSYQRVVLDKEGSDLAPVFNAQGYTLFVMTYRMPNEGHREGADAPLADAQRAIRTLRADAAKWHIDPHRIGVMGFSAGGACSREPGNPLRTAGLCACG